MALAGRRVTLVGLKKADLNGRSGEAVSFDEERGRYVVQLDAETIRVRPENVQLAEPEELPEMTEEEMGEEILECARYGEEPEVQQLLEAKASPDFADDTGNTALHKASANGHAGVVKLLAAAGASHLPNESGNSPLHWAVQQGQLPTVKALLELYPHADVLAQNSFGRSVSTEAFGKGDPQIVDAVLAHASAAKLDPQEGEGEGGEDDHLSAEVTHELHLGAEGDPPVFVRELAEVGSDEPTTVLGASFTEDMTGLQLWAAALVLSRWLVDLGPTELAGKDVTELGAGCGLGGLVAAKLCAARKVLITDLAERTMSNIEHNLEINGLAPEQAAALTLDWSDAASWPVPQQVLVGSDLVYCSEAVPLLLRVVDTLVAEGGVFFYVAPETNRLGEREFLDGMCGLGFERHESAVPTEYLSNALPDRSEEDFYILFSELKQRTYTLYRFQRASGGQPAVPQRPIGAAIAVAAATASAALAS